MTESMLVRVKLGAGQKFVKITKLSLKEFLSAAFLKFGVLTAPENVMVVDELGTEVDDDVFEDVVKDPSVGVLTIKYGADLEPASPQVSPVQSNWSLSSSIDSTDSKDILFIKESSSSKQVRLDDEAKELVESVLVQKPGGKRIINEYNRTKSLTDETRRKMVNILAADMTEKNGTSPPRQVKEKYARGIVALFPNLSNRFSKNGYEHYYDGESGTGYLAWRIKTIQRGLAKKRRASYEEESASPVKSNRSLSSSVDTTDSTNALIIKEGFSSTQMSLDDEAKKLVESILVQKPGGKRIINEYTQTKSLKDETRRKMVNILAADMIEKNGTAPPRQVKEKYARGIVALFPNLRNPYSKNGYEHYYDAESGTGYLAWRIKTIQRGLAKERRDLESDSSQASPAQSNQSPSSSTDSKDTLIIKESSSATQTRPDDEAKKLVESILIQKPGGERIINEYNRTQSLKDKTRRKMVNILAADMTENHGTSPPRQVKEKYARGIVALFPNLSDPYSKTGYEHYYDGESGTGYLAWRIKTIQRGLAKKRRESFEGQGSSAEGVLSAGPTVKQETEFTVLSEHECKEAIAFMNHSDDEDAIRKKMILTFDYRHKMVPDLMHSSDILTVFPRFKDIQGLIEQDFVLMFGGEVSGKLLEKWTTTFKHKVIQQCKKLPVTRDVEELLLAAQAPTGDSEEGVHFVWDSDLSSILLLLHLIPPSAQGRKRPGKVSASQAQRHLVVFKQSGSNPEEHLRDVPASAQPYLLAVGPQRDSVQQYFIVFNQHVIPCKSTSSLDAFDELFKAHFVFGTSYHTMLQGMYTFIQTTVYNIAVGKAKESPRVAEIRARLLS